MFRDDDEGRFIVFIAARFGVIDLTEIALTLLDLNGFESALRYLMHAWSIQHDSLYHQNQKQSALESDLHAREFLRELAAASGGVHVNSPRVLGLESNIKQLLLGSG